MGNLHILSYGSLLQVLEHRLGSLGHNLFDDVLAMGYYALDLARPLITLPRYAGPPCTCNPIPLG
jgi:hypothetical protein